MPPNEECPNCHEEVEDWHIEWYRSEGPALVKGVAAMDCPLCGGAVGIRRGIIGPAPAGVPMVRRQVDKAAEWAATQAVPAGKTLLGYVSTIGAGLQYANYWTQPEIQQADLNEQAKSQGP